MLLKFLKRLRQQVILLVIVALVLVAAYVSAGRLFMPAIARYSSFFESQITTLTGVPASIQSLTGSFQGFNPIIRVNGLRILVGGDSDQFTGPEASALVFDSATLIVDIPQSIWQRRWVFEGFVIETLEVNIKQLESGQWQFSGLDIAGDAALDLDAIYQSFLGVSSLNLRNVKINVSTKNGSSFSFINGSASIQKFDQTHFLYINTNLEGSNQQLTLSLEVKGKELAEIDGRLHIDIPEADYMDLVGALPIYEVTFEELIGGGDFWIHFADGKFADFTSQIKVDSVTLYFDEEMPLTLSNIEGLTKLSKTEEGAWELSLYDMALSWEDSYWRPFNIFTSLHPNQNLIVQADNLDLALLSGFALSSGFLSDSVNEQLAQYLPSGQLENFSAFIPLAEESDEHWIIKTNLSDGELSSRGSSPNMWGINGYAEVDYDIKARLVTGLAEIDSDEFSINIPNIFTEVWDYSHVNGKLNYKIDMNDGQRVQILSSVIIADSTAADGRVQFTSMIHRHANGEREADFELLVGAQRVDATQKAMFLPDGPNIAPALRNNMAWLDGAILGGTVFDSGVIYTRSTLPGAASETKTFQSFFQVSDGEFNYADEWPNLSDLDAVVYTDDNNIDVGVRSGSSMGIEMGAAIGNIRRNESGESWVAINGQTAGLTTQALAFLQAVPVGEQLKNTFSDWQAQGNFAAEIDVRVPLSQPDAETEVRLNLAVTENKIVIPGYGLAVEKLTGPVIFDTQTGLEESHLNGELFGQAVELSMSSKHNQGDIEKILVNAVGSATPEELIRWPLQSNLVEDLLGQMDGLVNFDASLTLDQQDASERSTSRLKIDSSLTDVSIALPHPYRKESGIEYSFNFDIELAESNQLITGQLGPETEFELELTGGELTDGLVFLGENGGNFSSLVDNDIEGLVILGTLDRFEFEQWTRLLEELSTVDNPSAQFSDSVAFIDLGLDALELYGQVLPNVNMRVESDPRADSWLVELMSDAALGKVSIPFDEDDYIELDFDYLRFSGDEDDEVIDTVNTKQSDEEEVDRIDVLASMDPRTLPKMRFSTDDFSIGSRSYGRWDFTLNPSDTGAEFSDLVFDFRGLRVGLDDLDENGKQQLEDGLPVPHFSWLYDGENHHSSLAGILYADNLADVLQANGYAASLESDDAYFITDVDWPGTPAFFSAAGLSGNIELEIDDGRFLQGAAGNGALKLISIINFDAIMRRLRFSDDLLRSGLAYEEISAVVNLENGLVNIEDRLVISGPSSLYQITGEIDLANETILGEMFVTLPVSDNIPWLGLLTANLPLAVGAYLFDQIFGDQINSLTSAVYTLDGPWEGLEPEFKQAFGSPDSPEETVVAPQ